MTKKIILDCDPGHDDAVAILLALGNPEIELLGVTTVGGNQSLEKVTSEGRGRRQQLVSFAPAARSVAQPAPLHKATPFLAGITATRYSC